MSNTETIIVMVTIIGFLVAWTILSDILFDRRMRKSDERFEKAMQTFDQAELFALSAGKGSRNFEMSEEALHTLAAVLYNTIEVSQDGSVPDVRPFALVRTETKQAYIKAAKDARTFVLNGLQRQAKEQGEP